MKVLQRLWLVAGQPCGKYLAPVMTATLANMENHPDSTPFGKQTLRSGPAVRAQLLAMSPATIDRIPAPYKARLRSDRKSAIRSRETGIRR